MHQMFPQLVMDFEQNEYLNSVLSWFKQVCYDLNRSVDKIELPLFYTKAP